MKIKLHKNLKLKILLIADLAVLYIVTKVKKNQILLKIMIQLPVFKIYNNTKKTSYYKIFAKWIFKP